MYQVKHLNRACNLPFLLRCMEKICKNALCILRVFSRQRIHDTYIRYTDIPNVHTFPYPPFCGFRQGKTPLSEPHLFYYPFCTCGFKTRKSQRHAWQEQELNLRFVQMLNPTCLIAPRSESGLSCLCPFSVCKDCTGFTVTEEYLPELPTCGIEPPAQAIRTRTLCFSCQPKCKFREQFLFAIPRIGIRTASSLAIIW